MKRKHHALKVDEMISNRQIEPEMEQAARKADVPEGTVYDTSMIDSDGAGDFAALTLVLSVVGVFLVIIAVFLMH